MQQPTAAFTAATFLVPDVKASLSGRRYEDTYGGWLSLFHSVAMAPRDMTIRLDHVPWSWVPLLWELGVDVTDPYIAWPECKAVAGALYGAGFAANPIDPRRRPHAFVSEDSEFCDVCNHSILGHEDGPDKEEPLVLRARVLDRHLLEVLCAFRPETVDALWKVDQQWRPARVNRRSIIQKSFSVTCNGSFWREEIRHFIDVVLPAYTPPLKKVVLVPCAADKPYPSPMHKAVLARLPSDYYLAIATGVLGIVPADLWPEMPNYDSGIPNEWRLLNVAADYFRRCPHDRVVCYVDFYSIPLQMALASTDTPSAFVNEIKRYDDYIDLLAPSRLAALERSLKE